MDCHGKIDTPAQAGSAMPEANNLVHDCLKEQPQR
jgi:hypothetical protein